MGLKATTLLLWSFSLLFVMGLVMVFDTASAQILDSSLQINTHYPLIKQLTLSLVGLVGGGMLYLLGYEKVLRLAPLLFMLSCLLLSLVFIPYFGLEMKGAKRWIRLLGISFQPAELAKYLVPFYSIGWLIKNEGEITLKSFYQHVGIVSIALLLILLQPDNGTAVILFITLFMLFLLAGVPWKYWAIPLAALLVIGVVAAYHMPHVPGRIRAYLHPEDDIQGKGHQPYQAKIAAGSGQLFGRGLGESMQKLSYLPEAKSDYIAAIYAEEFGFAGITLLIFLYGAIFVAGYVIALQARNKDAFYMAAVISFLIAFQVFLNLGVVSGLLPSKGTTLPFFSQGGTAQITNLLAICLLLSIPRRSKKTSLSGSEL